MPLTREERQRRNEEQKAWKIKWADSMARTLKAPATEFHVDAFHVFPDMVPFTERELDLFRRLVFTLEETEERISDVRQRWESKTGL